MPSITIQSTDGLGANPGSQMTVAGTWADLVKIRIEVKCEDDNGDWDFASAPAGGPPIVLNADGTYSATFDSPCGCGKICKVVAIGLAADGTEYRSEKQIILECSGDVVIEEVDCCPKAGEVTVAIFVDPACTANCQREVSFKLDYLGAVGAGCPSGAFMEVSISNSSGAIVASWGVIQVPLGGPVQVTHTAVLAPGTGYLAEAALIVNNKKCHGTSVVFDVRPCDHAPACPTGLTLAAFDIGCSADSSGACLPTAQFVIGGTFGIGCGSIAATVLKLDFGDGSPTAAIPVATAGSQQLVVAHRYVTGGWKNGVLSVAHPAGCSPATLSAAVKLEDCIASDCVTCDPPPSPPAWCLCKSCWLFSKKPGKGWCKPLLALFIPFLAVAIFGFLHGFLFAPTAQAPWVTATFLIASLGSAFYLTAYSDWCGNCCAACAIWPAILLGILFSLLAWWGGTPPLNGPIVWVLVLIGVVLTGAYLSWSYGGKCKDEERDQLGPDDWCKEAL